MKADLTRNSFDPRKNFSRVVMQQGRVQLDADWNEQAGILLRLMRRFALDLFGPAFSPAGGFAIAKLDSVDNDVVIQNGSYYLDGTLCELNATPVPISELKGQTITVERWTVDEVPFQVGQYLQILDQSRKPAMPICKITALDYSALQLTLDQTVSKLKKGKYYAQRLTTYLTQPDLPTPAALAAGTSVQLYLDVWERLVTSVEDDSIREVALNGPDTAARARVVRQVRALALDQKTAANGLSAQDLYDQFQPVNRGLLRAQTKPGQASTDPCTVSPDSRYRGPENQLYRVEIHTGSGVSGTPASFKWSRENGAVVFPIVALSVSGSTTGVTLANLGRDDRFGSSKAITWTCRTTPRCLPTPPGRCCKCSRSTAPPSRSRSPAPRPSKAMRRCIRCCGDGITRRAIPPPAGSRSEATARCRSRWPRRRPGSTSKTACRSGSMRPARQRFGPPITGSSRRAWRPAM